MGFAPSGNKHFKIRHIRTYKIIKEETTLPNKVKIVWQASKYIEVTDVASVRPYLK